MQYDESEAMTNGANRLLIVSTKLKALYLFLHHWFKALRKYKVINNSRNLPYCLYVKGRAIISHSKYNYMANNIMRPLLELMAKEEFHLFFHK